MIPFAVAGQWQEIQLTIRSSKKTSLAVQTIINHASLDNYINLTQVKQTIEITEHLEF